MPYKTPAVFYKLQCQRFARWTEADAPGPFSPAHSRENLEARGKMQNLRFCFSTSVAPRTMFWGGHRFQALFNAWPRRQRLPGSSQANTVLASAINWHHWETSGVLYTLVEVRCAVRLMWCGNAFHAVRKLCKHLNQSCSCGGAPSTITGAVDLRRSVLNLWRLPSHHTNHLLPGRCSTTTRDVLHHQDISWELERWWEVSQSSVLGMSPKFSAGLLPDLVRGWCGWLGSWCNIRIWMWDRTTLSKW